MRAATAGMALALFVFLPLASFFAARAHWQGAWLFYLPPLLIYLMLARLFHASLRPGHDPLISRFARLEQGTLTPELQSYTRTLTCVWSGFFVLMAAVSASLALWAPFALWSLFTHLVSYLLLAALFFGEYLYRLRRFRNYRHASPWQLLQTVRRAGLRRTPVRGEPQ